MRAGLAARVGIVASVAADGRTAKVVFPDALHAARPPRRAAPVWTYETAPVLRVGLVRPYKGSTVNQAPPGAWMLYWDAAAEVVRELVVTDMRAGAARLVLAVDVDNGWAVWLPADTPCDPYTPAALDDPFARAFPGR